MTDLTKGELAANPIKGEVAFLMGDATFTLSYSIDSLCVLEDRLDMSVGEIGGKLTTGMRLSFLRSVFWGGLRDHHPGIDERSAGEMIATLGGDKVGQLLAVAFFRAFPKAKDVPARPRKPAPKKTPAGIGKSSTRPGATLTSARPKPSGGSRPGSSPSPSKGGRAR